MLYFSPLKQKLMSLFIKQYKKNQGSKNCPNDKVFYFAYKYINSNPNHMIESISKRQNVIILHILYLYFYAFSLICFRLFFPK